MSVGRQHYRERGKNEIWEMLKMARYSFAMANAAESIKSIARYQTDDNNHQGALNVIQAVLDNHSPFDA